MSGKQAKRLRKLAKQLISSGKVNAEQQDKYKYSDKRVKPSKKKMRKEYAKRGLNPKEIEHYYIPEGYSVDSSTIELFGCEKSLVKMLKKEQKKFNGSK